MFDFFSSVFLTGATGGRGRGATRFNLDKCHKAEQIDGWRQRETSATANDVLLLLSEHRTKAVIRRPLPSLPSTFTVSFSASSSPLFQVGISQEQRSAVRALQTRDGGEEGN